MPDRTPLVSVVIPTYNQASYLPEAIDSVLAQTYAPIELIVVDDGSTDDTPAVISRYGPRITAIRQANRGAANALNVGLKSASGELICWLSSDDAFLPDKVTRQVAALADHPAAGLCCTGWETIDAEGRTLRQYPTLDWIHPDPVVAIFWRNPINGTTAMIPRAVFDEVGYFNEKLPADVDGDMWLRIADQREIITVPEILARYRIHAAAQSRDLSLMRTWKAEVRMARVTDGTIARRVRAHDGPAAPAVLARIGQDQIRQGMPRLARALLVASLRTGVAAREQSRLARSLWAPELSSRKRSITRHAKQFMRSMRRLAARIPGLRVVYRAVRAGNQSD